MSASGTARHLHPRPEVIAGGGDAVEAEFARDRWNAFLLGIPARRGRNTASFTNITQPWLRDSVKTWCRFRLGAGYSFNTIDATGQNMARFSAFLAGRPEVVDAAGLDREVIEAFLVWIDQQMVSVDEVNDAVLPQKLPGVGSPSQHPRRASCPRDHLRRRSHPAR